LFYKTQSIFTHVWYHKNIPHVKLINLLL